MKTKLFGCTLIALTVGAVVAYPALNTAAGTQTVPPPIETAQARKVEVVFVLDTTSSMTGLIETAKSKIWSIASTLAQAEQSPEVSMGLVAYRDRGDAYVTEVVDLSTDLDSMYAKLMRFAAVGGGDGPESVNAALRTAVHDISWSQDPSSYQVVFLVGDAPPHMDYQDEIQYPEIVQAAVAKGIVVNTIQCGDAPQTIAPWTQIARLGNGRYMKVGQSGDAFAVTTPFDTEIARLAAELDETRLFYGSEDELELAHEKAEATMRTLGAISVADRARRGVFNATAAGFANLFGDRDLVLDVTSGEVALEAVPEDNLPASIRSLDPAMQQAAIDGLVQTRTELKGRIDALTDSRAAYIEDRLAETEGAEDSLERQIYDAVREQAAPLGLSYESGPDY
jgi:uncharacterized protein YegL